MTRSAKTFNLFSAVGLMALAVGCSDCGGGTSPSMLKFSQADHLAGKHLQQHFRFGGPTPATRIKSPSIINCGSTAAAGLPVSGTLVFEPGDLIAN